MEIYDISQTLRVGMPVWPGDSEFGFRRTMQIRKGNSCNTSAVSLSVHAGTHLDAPFHFDDSGADIGSVDLAHYVGPARIVEIRSERSITARVLESLDWQMVERVLFKTRTSLGPEDVFDRNFVSLSEDAADFLGGLGLRLVGIDSPSVDAFESKTLGVHRILLRHGAAILEGARLRDVSPGDYELVCLPLKLAGLDGSPVRAILRR